MNDTDFIAVKNMLFDGIIPSWLRGEILEVCPYCGSEIISSYNLTTQRCSNKFCAGHLSHRAVEMCRYLGIKGIAEKTCERYIKSYNLKSHFDILKYLLKTKPKVYLWEIAVMACIPGYRDKAKAIFSRYNSFEEYFEENKYSDFSVYKDLLINAQQYFEILKTSNTVTFNSKVIKVMLHGDIQGYEKREHLLDDINMVLGDKIYLKPVGAVKGADLFVSEQKVPNLTGKKYEIVKQSNGAIPIIPPNELFSYIVFHELIKLFKSEVELANYLREKGCFD